MQIFRKNSNLAPFFEFFQSTKRLTQNCKKIQGNSRRVFSIASCVIQSSGEPVIRPGSLFPWYLCIELPVSIFEDFWLFIYGSLTSMQWFSCPKVAKDVGWLFSLSLTRKEPFVFFKFLSWFRSALNSLFMSMPAVGMPFLCWAVLSAMFSLVFSSIGSHKLTFLILLSIKMRINFLWWLYIFVSF